MATTSPNTLMEMYSDTKIEAAKDGERRANRELAQIKAQSANHPVVRTAAAIGTAALSTHFDTMIGDGKGDAFKIGTAIGASVSAGVAWKFGAYGFAHGMMDTALGAGCALVAVNTREAGLKAAAEREAKRAAAQAAKPA